MKLAFVPFALVALSAVTFADPQLRKDTVVKVTFDQTVSLGHGHIGDTFTATVAEGPDLPVGSKFIGRIADIHPADDRHPAYMDLRFEAVRLPDNRSFGVRAVPVKMDYIRRDAEGRFRIDQPKVRKENYVLGGLLGGTLLGSIFHRSFEGAFVGVLAGIVVAESSASDSAEGIAVHRGDAMGALIQEDTGTDNPYHAVDARSSMQDDDDPYGRGRLNRNDDVPAHPVTRNDDDEDPYGRGGSAAPVRTPDVPSHPVASDDDDPYGSGRHSQPKLAPDAVVTIDDRTITFAKALTPYYSDKTLMVPIRSMAAQLKLDVDEANEGHVLYLSNDDITVRIEQGAVHYRLNGKRDNLPKPIELRNGVLYGPIDLFSQMHMGTVRINGTKLEKPA